MDPRSVVLDISSDEEAGGGDNFDWISELLDEADDESNDVMVVLNPKQRFKSSIVVVNDLDDECVILDGDPEKVVEIDNDARVGESDDLLLVGEKGQVACRDYPHPRYLCANFPFSSSPHEKHCDRCHCYICDSLAPCILWGRGTSSDHCHATDKDEYWKLLRKCWKNKDKAPLPAPKAPATPLSVRPPQMNQVPPSSMPVPNYVQHNPLSLIQASSISAPFGIPNIISQPRKQQSGYIVSKDKFQPYLVSQQLLTKCNNSTPRDRRNDVGNLGPRFISPRVLFKRTGSTGVAYQTNRFKFRLSNNNHGSQYFKNPRPVARQSNVGGRISQPNAACGFVAQHQISLQPNASSLVPSLLQVRSQPYTGPVFEKSMPSQPQVSSQHQVRSTFASSVPSQPRGDSNNGQNIFQLGSQTQSALHPSFTGFEQSWVPAENSQLQFMASTDETTSLMTQFDHEFTGSTNPGSLGYGPSIEYTLS